MDATLTFDVTNRTVAAIEKDLFHFRFRWISISELLVILPIVFTGIWIACIALASAVAK